jgi:hypothetical protein
MTKASAALRASDERAAEKTKASDSAGLLGLVMLA